MLETKNFKKRFHCCAITEKRETVNYLSACVFKKQMPGGRATTEEEFKALNELLEWCNMNIFFDFKPSAK